MWESSQSVEIHALHRERNVPRENRRTLERIKALLETDSVAAAALVPADPRPTSFKRYFEARP